MFYMDEIGTLPKIEDLEMIFSASRSRKISIVAIIQSLAQFEKNYGKEGAEIIVDNYNALCSAPSPQTLRPPRKYPKTLANRRFSAVLCHAPPEKTAVANRFR